jgi:hypothetical protein
MVRRSTDCHKALMTVLDATIPAAQTGLAAPAGNPVRFVGEARFFWHLLVRGAVLLMFTLGIYRFWLITDIRRFLWSNTELSGEAAGAGPTRPLLDSAEWAALKRICSGG